MARAQIKIPKSVVQKYLEAKEGGNVTITGYEKLGSGWHGTGYMVSYKGRSTKGKIRQIVLRTLMPSNFSHDYASDRAKVFILQHEMARGIPGHISSYDVSGYTGKGQLVSLGDINEFFQVVEVAKGTAYSQDFQRIKESGKLKEEDLKKAKALSDYLVGLHSKKIKADRDVMVSLRRRHSRDAIGHGEMMVGVVDTYPDDFSFISKEKLTDIICKATGFREKVKDTPFVPCRMHGDFHPANILFSGSKFTVLDASREVYGDPADDVTTMAINYIWFAVMQSGSFSGPFERLFRAFWDNYMKKAGSEHILRTAGVYFAFRGVVVAHPVFYQAQSDDTRRKMMAFVEGVLSEEKFDPDRINEYLELK